MPADAAKRDSIMKGDRFVSNCDSERIDVRNRLSDSVRIGILRVPHLLTGVLLLALVVSATTAGLAQNDVEDQGGPVMQAPKVFLIFWLPPSFHFDSSGSTGDTTYQAIVQRFFSDVSAGSYLNIISQYPGICAPPNISTQKSCFGSVTVASVFLETRPYPHAGTFSDPLTDSDIRGEVANFIAQRNLTPGLDTEFFVFTGANVNECTSFGCTSTDFCGYHGHFSLNSNTVTYAFMPNAASLSGCDESITGSPNQLSADREIIVASHEFAESISDPLVPDTIGWNDSITGSEVGDICVPWQSPTGLGALNSDGSNISLNGHPYVVQEEWSNDDAACVLAHTPAISG